MATNTKALLATALLVVTLFEFVTAMQVFGKKSAHNKLMLRMHRIGGYVYLILFAGLFWVGIEMLGRFGNISSWQFGPRKFGHALLATMLIAILLLKLAMVRVYPNYRRLAQPLGIVLAVGTAVLWVVAAWMYWALLAGVKPAG